MAQNFVSFSADTGILDVKDVRRAEEGLAMEEDDGITLEPFNLVKEREEGRFDEAGNYVENKEEEDADAQDAWLASDEGQSCARHKIQVLPSSLNGTRNWVLLCGVGESRKDGE